MEFNLFARECHSLHHRHSSQHCGERQDSAVALARVQKRSSHLQMVSGGVLAHEVERLQEHRRLVALRIGECNKTVSSCSPTMESRPAEGNHNQSCGSHQQEA